ncbi:hypothetical protein [Poseidonocella sp. HB161398]|uniref:hypothetical protein n=1 Tax=Poseidonocella sp. HB161398 TaxID=2320855 RepID=UPI001109B329|nr:hypothetical protein [Poseidonocella sp. HB161398]
MTAHLRLLKRESYAILHSTLAAIHIPDRTIHYLMHTTLSWSLRAIARAAKVEPSTILRQVRSVTNQRDQDPLFDAALASTEAKLNRALPAK